MKTAFLFPGQGAQSVGMGADIFESFDKASEIFDRANELLDFDVKRLCFQGPEDRLNSTTVSQPAIFTVSAAILEVIRNHPNTQHLKPDVTAGLSLGEYTALYAAGVLSFEDGLKLVAKRGKAMQDASDATEGSMVSIIGLEPGKVEQLCQEARKDNEILKGVNFNCPGQVVISGSKAACERAVELAPEYEAIKAIKLAVAGAFHTELMSQAADQLKQAISECEISDPKEVKVIANISGEYYKNSDQIADGLVKQLTCPILWQKCMERLLDESIQDYYEIGPGKVLRGLMRRINRKTKVINLSNSQSLKKLLGGQ